MSLTAFVTGASGFVGCNLVAELHRQGWQVHVLARSTASLDDIEGIPFTRHTGDISDANSLENVIPAGADAVFHVAARTTFWSRRNAMQKATNVDGTANVMDAAIRAGAGRFIHTSSFATWGFPDGVFNEDSPRTDRSDWINYVRTKYLAEQLVLDAVAEKQIDAVILNPANILGPGDRHNWSRMFRMVQQGKLPAVPPGGGNFCDVREVSRAHVRAFHDGRNGEKYLLGGPFAPYAEVIRIAAESLGKRVPRMTVPAWIFRTLSYAMVPFSGIGGNEPDITPESAMMASRNVNCDSSKAKRELAYRAVPLRTMIEDTIDWMKDQGLLK